MCNAAVADNLANTPPMGWNSFNTFGCDPSEELIIETADAICALGLKEAGYTYVNIDDGWMEAQRDSEGNLVCKRNRFPRGMGFLTDYLHTRGLKAGIYLGCGLRTYNEKPGSLGYEQRDAELIAKWGFDFLKYDCRTLPEDPPSRDIVRDYVTMSDALKSTGRPVVFSLCEHGRTRPWEWAVGVGHLWRTTTDIKDCTDGEFKGGWGFNKILDETHHLHVYAGPGQWNDPDMLIVGLHGINYWMGPGCKDHEYRAHFSLWCLVAAPLLIGCDVRKMSEYTRETLLNREVIEVNQDILGHQGYRVKSDEGLDVWLKQLFGGDSAVGLYNRREIASDMAVTCRDIGLPVDSWFSVRDLWEHMDLGAYKGCFVSTVQPHECRVFRISPRTKR